MNRFFVVLNQPAFGVFGEQLFMGMEMVGRGSRWASEDSMDSRIKKIRRKVFSEKIPLDVDLLQIVEGFSSHNFLKNPSGQNVYLYLTKYVKVLCEYYCNKDIKELNILDWGCGKGHVTFLLSKLGANHRSCDIDSDSPDASFGQETPIIDKNNIEVDPITHEYILPYNDETMDVVLSFGVLEHVAHDYESLINIKRILRKEGLLFCFSLPYSFSWTQRIAHIRGDHYHDRLYHKRRVNELLKSSGFDILDMWHRQLFPKNSIKYPQYRLFERLDQFLTEHTPLKYLATNIEFVAAKRELPGWISHCRRKDGV